MKLPSRSILFWFPAFVAGALALTVAVLVVFKARLVAQEPSGQGSLQYDQHTQLYYDTHTKVYYDTRGMVAEHFYSDPHTRELLSTPPAGEPPFMPSVGELCSPPDEKLKVIREPDGSGSLYDVGHFQRVPRANGTIVIECVPDNETP